MVSSDDFYHLYLLMAYHLSSFNVSGTFDILYDIKWLASLNLARLGIEKTTLMQ